MKLLFNVTFKRGSKVVVIIEGQRPLGGEDLTIGEVVDKVLETEQFLEKLTGLRVHIEQVS